jgi:Ran GTPase-activating protein (RanGAP) involved in mRNA processing and transport
LRNADVDDFECERFVEAIKNNNSLVELDLSNNKIGSAENLNTVMPDLVTGGEALAELLRLPQCKLKTLKVDWNMIRLDGAVDFASSLQINDTLTYLDLSFNSLSTAGGITLGVSILYNHRLETLILTSNNIDSVACFTICAGIMENRGLKKVVMDGNPIGEQVLILCLEFVLFCFFRMHVLHVFVIVFLDVNFTLLGNESANVSPYDCWKPCQGLCFAVQY